MRAKGYVLGIVVLGLAVVAAAVRAGESAAPQVESRVEVRTLKPGDTQPEVRIWVNGKEVKPGDAVELGEGGRVRVEARAEAAEGRAERSGTEKAAGPPILGVMVGPLDDELREKSRAKTGVVITSVLPDSPAAKADLRVDDVIISVDSKPVESPEQLVDRIHGYKPGDRVRLMWMRDGKRMMDSVVLRGQGEEPARERERPRPRPEGRPEGKAGEAFLGVLAAPLSEEMREIAGTDKGVLINTLTDDSPAAKAGLQPGDVITSVGGKEVVAPGALVETIREHKPGDRLGVVYFRMGKRREAMVTLGERPGEAGRAKEGAPLSDLPDQLFKEMPGLRDLVDRLRPQVEEWARKYSEGPLVPGQPLPPMEGPRLGPRQEPYDVGKDMGRILERLDRIEKRLNEIEQRLDKRER